MQILIFRAFRQTSFFFSWLGADGVTYETDGQLTTIVFNLESSSHFTLDDGDFFIFDEITDFKNLITCIFL